MNRQSDARSLATGVVELMADNGHYPAFVVDVWDPKDQYVVSNASFDNVSAPAVLLRFVDDWRPKEAFPLSRIRLAPMTRKCSDQSKDMVNGQDTCNDVKEGDEVEVLSCGKGGEAPRWWPAVVQMVKGEFFIVADMSDPLSKKSSLNNYTEIATKDNMRAINHNQYLTWNPFFQFLVEVPKDMLKMCGQAITKKETHRHFRTALNLFAVNYDEKDNRLICVGIVGKDEDKRQWFEKTVKRTSLLIDIHWRSLRAEFEKREQLQVMRLQLNEPKATEVVKSGEDEYEVLVRVEDHLMGYAIGHKGANISRALKVPGVKTVDRLLLERENIFKITGTSQKALQTAKEIIQIMEEVVEIPRDIVGHVIGKHGQLVQEVTDKSNLIIINVKGDDPQRPRRESVPFHLIGTREAIEDAKLLLEFHISCVKENLAIDKELAHKRSTVRHTIR